MVAYKMLVYLTCISAALLLSAAAIESSANRVETLQNIVGRVDGEVTLTCDANTTGAVLWSYQAPGATETSPIRCRHRIETTNYGKHRVILENLRLDDAGTYVCWTTEDPRPFDAAGAYVLVVAFGPFCFSNVTAADELEEGTGVKLTCVVTYAAVPGVELELAWKQAGEDGFTDSRNFSSESHGLSFHSLTTLVISRPPVLPEHTCRATFHDVGPRDMDNARNSPIFQTNSTCVLPDRAITVRSHNVAPRSSIPPALSTTLAECPYDGVSYATFITVVSILCILLPLATLAARTLACWITRQVRNAAAKTTQESGVSLLTLAHHPHVDKEEDERGAPTQVAEDNENAAEIVQEQSAQQADIVVHAAELNPLLSAATGDTRREAANIGLHPPVVCPNTSRMSNSAAAAAAAISAADERGDGETDRDRTDEKDCRIESDLLDSQITGKGEAKSM